MVTIRIDPFPSQDDLGTLWKDAWGCLKPPKFADIVSRSLTHVGAYEGEYLVGFVNVAWDGGVHAFILDTCVHPRLRRRGIASRMVVTAKEVARERGARWLHVDFEPHLISFYRECGFRHSEAGVLQLK